MHENRSNGPKTTIVSENFYCFSETMVYDV